MIPYQSSLPEAGAAEREPRDLARPPRRKGLLAHIADARADRLAAEAPRPSQTPGMVTIVGVTALLFLGSLAWKRMPPRPSGPAPVLTGHAIVVVDGVRGCGGYDNQCVTFRKGMKLIVEGHERGFYLVRRIAAEPAYSVPDRYLEPERAP